MKQKLVARLSVNDNDIDMNEYVEGLVAHITVGIVKSHKGVDNIKTIDINIKKGEVYMMVNDEDIPLTPFPNDIVAGILTGLVSMLKGVDTVDRLKIRVEAG